MAEDRDLGKLAEQWLAMRRYRARFFSSELFDEYAWDMLLHLFAAAAEERIVSDEELIVGTTGRLPSGLRWIAHLEKEGEVARTAHRGGTVTVALTATATDRMRAFLTGVERADTRPDNQPEGPQARQAGA